MASLKDQVDELVGSLDDPIKILEDFAISRKLPKTENPSLAEGLGGQPPPSGPEIPHATPPAPVQTAPTPAPAPSPPKGLAEQANDAIKSAIFASPFGAPSLFKEFAKTGVGSVTGTVPLLAGDFTDALGVVSDNSTLSEVGRKVADFGSKQQKSFSPRVPSYTDIRTDDVGHFIDDAWDYAQGSAGGAVGTTLPPMALGLLGGIPGAASASYILNSGDAYGTAKRDPEILKLIESGALTPKQVAGSSLAAGTAMAALDVWGVASILGTVTQPYKRALAKQIIKSGLTEMTTEGLQEGISIANQEVLGDDVPKKEAVERIINNMVGGLLGGTTLGGAHGALSQSRQELLQERMNALGKDARPQLVRDIEALVGGEPQVIQGAQIPGEDLAPANQNSIFENVDDKGLVFGEYLDMADAMRQAQFLKDLGRGTIKTQEVPQTDAARYAAAVERQVTRRGTRNAFRVVRPAEGEGPTAAQGLGQSVEPEVFYSQLQRTVEDKKFPAKGKGSDLLNKLRSSPGVKAEEIAWTGLPELLANKPQVSKEEILQHLEENQVVVEEGLYGTSPGAKIDWRDLSGRPGTLGIFDPNGAIVDQYRQFRIQRTSRGRFELRTDIPGEGENYFTYSTLADAVAAAQRRADTISAESVGETSGGLFAGAPRFGHYVLPGPNENYRELLLKWAPPLPKVVTDIEAARDAALQTLVQRRLNTGQDISDEEMSLLQEATNRTKDVRSQRELERYTEPHFGRDVLAWVRMTERVDESGQKVLFIEELQSKWHQLGRAESYTEHVDEYELVRDGRVVDRGYDKETAERYAEGNNRMGNIGHYTIRPTGEKMRVMGAVPNAPFKSSWLDLLFKRMIRYAADNGYSRIAWTTGQMQVQRYGEHETTSPIKNLYDKVIPPVARKWAKFVGGTIGTTAIDTRSGERFEVYFEGDAERARAFATEREAREYIQSWVDDDPVRFSWDEFEIREQPETERVPFIDLPPEVFVQKPSFPRFAQGLKVGPSSEGQFEIYRSQRLASKRLVGETERAAKAIFSFVEKLGIKEKVYLMVQENFNDAVRRWGDAFESIQSDTRGFYIPAEDGGHIIALNMAAHSDVRAVYNTLAHEFGHLVFRTEWKNAPTSTKFAVLGEYASWRARIKPRSRLLDLYGTMSPVTFFEAYKHSRGKVYNQKDFNAFSTLDKDTQDYWLDEEEWFAERVAAWSQTSEKALSEADRWFKGLAQKLKKVLDYIREKFFPMEPAFSPTINSWLDNYLTEKRGAFEQLARELETATQAENLAALEAVGEDAAGATPITFVTQGPRAVIGGLAKMSQMPTLGPNRHWRARMRADAAHTDRIARRHAMTMGLLELRERFKHIAALNAYTEDIQAQMLMQQVLTDEAEVVRKAWDKLGPAQNTALANVMDDFMNMSYRTEEEIKSGVARNPTRAEFSALMQKHGLEQSGAQVFRQIHGHFMHLFNVYEQVLLDNVKTRGFSPEMELLKEAAINKQFELMRSRPFTPLLHFGRHAVEVRDASGNLIQREFYDSTKTADKAIFALNRRLQGTGYVARPREFTKESLPFINFPTAIQRAINEQLELTEGQAEDLQGLVEGDPVPIFRHQLMNRKGEKDFAHRLKRSFAWYSTRGATYIARLKFNAPLAGHIKQLHDEAKFMPDSRLRDGLANWLADHKKEQYSNRTDFAQLRAAGFFMYLGFMVPSAALNLTQAFFGTTPFLMAKFGPIAAVSVLRNGAAAVNYYRKGTLEQQSDWKGRMLFRSTQEKVTDESAAVELAGLSEGHNLLDRAGKLGPLAGRAFVGFKHGAAYLFTMAEKLLRRNSFSSAYDLAIAYPNNPFVAESVRMAPQKFSELVAEGVPRNHAAAYVTAQRTVEQTQYDYSRYAQPKFMRGVGRPLFMFKRFQHATLFMLYNHPKTMLYWLPLTLFFGGLMGIPGMEDLRGIAKWIASQIFGKDFDIEKEARKFVLEAFGGEKEILGREYFLPDLVTDGLSKYGFGLPHLLDLLGGTVGVDVPFPTLDRSRALGIGKLIPVPFDELAKQSPRDENPEFKAIKEAAGPVFGWAFQAFAQARKIMQHPLGKPGDKGLIPREWEPMSPKILARLSQAWRAYRDQATTTPDGTPIVKYDPRDPEQSAELIAKALGYQTLRESAKYEQIRRQGEVIQLWDTRKQMLLDQYWTAYQAKDPQEIKSVREAIVKFNGSLPPEARDKRISFGKGGTLERSIRSRSAVRAKREKEKALRKQDQSLIDEIRRLYPGSDPVSVQRVR